MKYEEYDSPRSQEELLASIPRIRIREGSVGGELRFAVLRDRRNEFCFYHRTGLDCWVKGTLSPCGAGTRIRFRVGPGPSTLSMLLILLGVELYCVVLLLNKGLSGVSALFLLIVSAALLILLLFYASVRREVREFFLRQLQVQASERDPSALS